MLNENQFNDFIGIPYDKHIYKPDLTTKKVNCNGFVCLLNQTYNKLFNRYSDMLKIQSNMQSNMQSINFTDRLINDIIVFSKDGQPDHVGILCSKTHFVHNNDTKYGSNICSIDFMLFNNYKISIFREI